MSLLIKPTPLKDTKVFQPIKVGYNTLSNKVVYAPTTRFRALPDHTPSDLELQYYKDRSSYPGTLVITEGTIATTKTGTYPNVPGIYTDKHVEAWKRITSEIHKNRSFASVQLWGIGRVADPGQNKKEGQRLKAPSAIYHAEEQKQAAREAGNELEAYSTEEIDELIGEYAKTAKRAVEAGFDYVELHGANGYLINQFLEASSNQRDDKYGGSIENRARFALSLIDRLSEEIGAERVAIRISPWSTFLGMKSTEDDVHPVATYGYLLGQLQHRAEKGKQIAYVSVVEPGVMSARDLGEVEKYGDNSFVKAIWKGVVLRAGNYTYDAPDFNHVLQHVDDGRTLVGFSRYFTSNPDLVQRLRDGKDLAPYDRHTFYTSDNWGYNTFGTSEGMQKFDEETERQRKPRPIEA